MPYWARPCTSSTARTRPWVTGSGPWYMPWRQSASMPYPAPTGTQVGRSAEHVVWRRRGAIEVQPGLGEANHRTVNDTGPGNEMVLVLGAAQILDGFVRVHPD